MQKLKVQLFESAFDATEKNPEVAAALCARADLMCCLLMKIRSQHWSLNEAAEHCGVSWAQIKDVVHSRIDRLSLSTLRAMVERVIPGIEV